MPSLSRRKLFAAWLVFAASLGFATAADAGASPVALGETKVVKPDVTLEREFRSLVERELDRLDLSGVQSRDHFVLSASLTQMKTQKSSGQAESMAVVSATLRRALGGTLHAVIQGRAQAVDGPNDAKSAEQSAMRAAVRSALRRVPEALK